MTATTRTGTLWEHLGLGLSTFQQQLVTDYDHDYANNHNGELYNVLND